MSENIDLQIDAAQTEHETHTASAPASSHGFSLATLMLIVTLVSVILGVTRLAPIIGLSMAIVALPAIVRTLIIRRHHAANLPATLANPIVHFAASGGIVLIAGLCAFVACLTAGFACGLVGLAGSAFFTSSMNHISAVSLVLGFAAGSSAALFTAYILVTNPDPNWGAFPKSTATRWERGIMLAAVTASVASIFALLFFGLPM
jgi:hypothetical protein